MPCFTPGHAARVRALAHAVRVPADLPPRRRPLSGLAPSAANPVSIAPSCWRGLLLPVAALGVAMLWRLDPTQTLVLLMFSAVPTASSCYVLAARMGYDGPYVAGLVTLSTALGVVSLPFALGVLLPLR